MSVLTPLHARLLETAEAVSTTLPTDPSAFDWKPAPKSAAAILRTEFREVRWVIVAVLPEGTYILAAKPKVGKSWFGLQLAVAVAAELPILGQCTTPGGVLYLALEDNERRLQKRLQKLLDGQLIDPAKLERLHFETQWRRGTDGAADLAVWLEAHPDARLVVIDTLERIRPTRGVSGAVYAEDYAAVSPFKALSDRFGVAILIIHHTRKSESDDPLESVSGTLGLTGSADGVLVLTRPRGEPRGELHLIGRDVEKEGAYVVEFDKDTCKWSLVGEAHEVADSEEQQAILDIIRELAPIQPREIAAETGRKDGTVRRLLHKLRRAGLVAKTPKGYTLAIKQGEQGEQGERCEQDARE